MDFEYDLIQTSKVTSSSNDKDSKAEHAIDGNPDTKWSAKGKNQFLELDLGEAKAVSGIAVKFYEADIRRAQYTIYVSEKGGKNDLDWKRIGTAVSSGNANNEYETNTFERPMYARFVKIVGEGNDLNSFTSIVDVKVLGNRKEQPEQTLVAGEIKTASEVAGSNTQGATVKADTEVTPASAKVKPVVK